MTSNIVDMADAPRTLPAEQLARTLFLQPTHECCECCAGYCPAAEVGQPWETTYEVTLGGIAYVGTSRVIVLAELVEVDSRGRTATPRAAQMYQVPATMPPLTNAPAPVYELDKLDLAGIERRADGDAQHLVHLYRAGRHIGWTARAQEGGYGVIRPDELEAVRRIAVAACCDLDQAVEAWHTAQPLIREKIAQALKAQAAVFDKRAFGSPLPWARPELPNELAGQAETMDRAAAIARGGSGDAGNAGRTPNT
jgi:hypothetical protein